MKYAIIGSYAAFGGLISCATPPTESSAPIAGEADVTKVSNVLETSLPAQTLDTNECGLFMWSKTDPSKFVFFNKAGENNALFLMAGKTTHIRTVTLGGDIFGQFFTSMDYPIEG